NQCASCASTTTKLLCCSRCRITRYCSRDCQASHWAVHRQICAKRGLAFSQQME
ncbi:hypothetical protein K438DRAFT_1432144, partial [Mycena galopus ATCC 62051]